MKRNPLLSSCLLAVAVLILAGQSPAQTSRNAAPSKLITVLNPAITDKLAERVPLAPRIDTLEGKTIYIVDTIFGRSW